MANQGVATAAAGAGSAAGPPPVSTVAMGSGPVPGPPPSTVTELCLAIGLADDARDVMLHVMGATLTTPLEGFSAAKTEEANTAC